MTDFNKYYRAYMQMQELLKDDFTYHYVTKALADQDKGEDLHSGKVFSRVIDMDWVEAIEDALMYIDKAIREQRRFIEQNEDIVPIEKAKKITNESVRHLAQHTSLIARVEGDKVTPERILDIQREESFAIYENRFLHTLLSNVMRFVEDRYKALKHAPEDTYSKMQMKRNVTLNQQVLDFELSYSNESHERVDIKVDLATDVETLTDFERVRRIRRVLSDFIASPLMRILSKAEPVRPPILRTNLMMKNPNFKKALDLWLFIETYKKTGFDIVGNEYDGKMEESVQQELYGVMSFQHFVMSMCTNSAWKAMLHEKYLEENARMEEENSAPDRERKKLEAYRIAKIREEEMQLRLDEVRSREKQISELKSNITSQKLTITQRENTIKELKGNLLVCEDSLKQCKDQLFQMEKQLSDYETTIQEQTVQIAQQAETIRQQEQSIQDQLSQIQQLQHTKAELEAAIAQLTDEKAGLEKTVNKQQAEIQTLNGELESCRTVILENASKINLLETRVNQQTSKIQEHNRTISDLSGQVSRLENDIASQKDSYDGQIRTLQMDHQNEIETIGAKNAGEIQRLQAEFSQEKQQLLEQAENQKQEIRSIAADEKSRVLFQAQKEKESDAKEIARVKKLCNEKIEQAQKTKQIEIEKTQTNADKALKRKTKEIKDQAAREIANNKREAKQQIKSANKNLKLRQTLAGKFVKTYKEKYMKQAAAHITQGETALQVMQAAVMAQAGSDISIILNRTVQIEHNICGVLLISENNMVYIVQYKQGQVCLLQQYQASTHQDVLAETVINQLEQAKFGNCIITCGNSSQYGAFMKQQLESRFQNISVWNVQESPDITGIFYLC